MEIYVKDKDLPKKTCENCPLCEHFEKDAHGKGKHEVACLYEGTFNNILFGDKLCPENCNIIKSLDQHDAEVRKPLEDEIAKLKQQEIGWQNKIDELYSEIKLLNIAYKNCQELRIEDRKQERQKVIAELEEWVDKNTSEGIYDEREDKWYLCVQIENIKQKLNEMKEGVKMEVFVSDKESNRQYISSCKIGNFNGKEIEGEFCEIKSLDQHDAEIRTDERNYVYNEMPKVLADSIIEITENLNKLDFFDLEKIARKFEEKLTELGKTLQGKGAKDE